jgi:hypothetical protein
MRRGVGSQAFHCLHSLSPSEQQSGGFVSIDDEYESQQHPHWEQQTEEETMREHSDVSSFRYMHVTSSLTTDVSLMEMYHDEPHTTTSNDEYGYYCYDDDNDMDFDDI